MQVFVPQLRSTTAKFGGEQTLMRTYNLITWNSFATLKAHPIWELVIEITSV
jgi:hypothetical protein